MLSMGAHTFLPENFAGLRDVRDQGKLTEVMEESWTSPGSLVGSLQVLQRHFIDLWSAKHWPINLIHVFACPDRCISLFVNRRPGYGAQIDRKSVDGVDWQAISDTVWCLGDTMWWPGDMLWYLRDTTCSAALLR